MISEKLKVKSIKEKKWLAQIEIKMFHVQVKLTRHTMIQTWRKVTTSFPIIYFVASCKVASKWQKLLTNFLRTYPSYKSHNFVGSWLSHTSLDWKAIKRKIVILEEIFSTLYHIESVLGFQNILLAYFPSHALALVASQG
jgi:hypothetical protein